MFLGSISLLLVILGLLSVAFGLLVFVTRELEKAEDRTTIDLEPPFIPVPFDRSKSE